MTLTGVLGIDFKHTWSPMSHVHYSKKTGLCQLFFVLPISTPAALRIKSIESINHQAETCPQITAASKILPEMTAYLEVLIASRKNVIAVPADSIVVLQNHGYVHIPDSNESKGYKELKVVTGINNAQYVEVIDGLKEQDKVMTIDLAKVDVSKLGKDDKSKTAKQ